MNGYEEAYGKSFSRFNREKIDGVVKNLQESLQLIILIQNLFLMEIIV